MFRNSNEVCRISAWGMDQKYDVTNGASAANTEEIISVRALDV